MGNSPENGLGESGLSTASGVDPGKASPSPEGAAQGGGGVGRGGVACASLLALWVIFPTSTSFWSSVNFAVGNPDTPAEQERLPSAGAIAVAGGGGVWLFSRRRGARAAVGLLAAAGGWRGDARPAPLPRWCGRVKLGSCFLGVWGRDDAAELRKGKLGARTPLSLRSALYPKGETNLGCSCTGDSRHPTALLAPGPSRGVGVASCHAPGLRPVGKGLA